MINKPICKSEQSADLLPLLVIHWKEPKVNFKNRRGTPTLFLPSSVQIFRNNWTAYYYKHAKNNFILFYTPKIRYISYANVKELLRNMLDDKPKSSSFMEGPICRQMPWWIYLINCSAFSKYDTELTVNIRIISEMSLI